MKSGQQGKARHEEALLALLSSGEYELGDGEVETSQGGRKSQKRVLSRTLDKKVKTTKSGEQTNSRKSDRQNKNKPVVLHTNNKNVRSRPTSGRARNGNSEAIDSQTRKVDQIKSRKSDRINKNKPVLLQTNNNNVRSRPTSGSARNGNSEAPDSQIKKVDQTKSRKSDGRNDNKPVLLQKNNVNVRSRPTSGRNGHMEAPNSQRRALDKVRSRKGDDQRPSKIGVKGLGASDLEDRRNQERRRNLKDKVQSENVEKTIETTEANDEVIKVIKEREQISRNEHKVVSQIDDNNDRLLPPSRILPNRKSEAQDPNIKSLDQFRFRNRDDQQISRNSDGQQGLRNRNNNSDANIRSKTRGRNNSKFHIKVEATSKAR